MPLLITIKQRVRFGSDNELGSCTVVPSVIAQDLPHDSWWLLEGVETGELWLRARFTNQTSPSTINRATLYDQYGFAVPLATARRWTRTASYTACRQVCCTSC